MGMEHDVRKIFEKILENNFGNKKAAAKALGINSMTFWGWVEGTRHPNQVIFQALDAAGARLLPPWEMEKHEEKVRLGQEEQAKLAELENRVAELEKDLLEAQETAKTWENMFRGAVEMSRAIAETQGTRHTTEGLEKIASSMGK